MARDIRQKALQKIAVLSASSTITSFDKSDLDRLCRAVPNNGKTREAMTNGHRPGQQPAIGRVPMAIREFEVLLALCKAAPVVQTVQNAEKLARQLVPYLSEAHTQVFQLSPFYRKIEPSPTEALTRNVTTALLSLGIRHGDVSQTVSDGIWAFLSACAQASEAGSSQASDDDSASLDDAIGIANVALALLGFLDAASAQANFWRAGGRLALVQWFRGLLSESFLVAVETALSTIRNSTSSERHVKEWKRYLRHYSAAGRPLGAMLLQQSFMWLLVGVTSLLVADVGALQSSNVLDILMSGDGLLRPLSRTGEVDFRSVETYAAVAVEQMNHLESSQDFLRLGTPAQQDLASSVKASALISYLNCAKLNQEAADPEVLMSWLEDALSDPPSLGDHELAAAVLKSTALLCRVSPAYAATVSRLLPRFIVQGGAQRQAVAVASKCLAFVLKMLSTDAVITTLYTLGNVLSPAGEQRRLTNGVNGDTADGRPDSGGPEHVYHNRQSTGSDISLPMSGEEETALAHGNVIEAICEIATTFKDGKITALAQSMLLQKLDKVTSSVDARIITEAATLALGGGQLEFRSLLKMYGRLADFAVMENKEGVLAAILKARNYISAHLRRDSPLYDIYWEHLLDSIISKGESQNHHSPRSESDVEMAAREIAQLLQPLAVLMSTNDLAMDEDAGTDTHAVLRDAWFTIVIHGFIPTTDRGKNHADELRVMAIHSPALVFQDRGEQDESDIELNTVLRRGMSSEREALLKRQLVELIPSRADDIRGLSYRRLVFLQAAYLVETLRADAGDCTGALSYFLEPSMRRNEVSRSMEGIMNAAVDIYINKTISASSPAFSAQYASGQLVTIFCHCCHRIERVQQAAFSCADRIIQDIPSALCHQSSLFALLELLSLLWTSCLEAETDRYEPRTRFRSARGRVTLDLSDDYAFRRQTLQNLHTKARTWMVSAVNLAPADVKGLLQTYLSEFDDEGAYGHVSLGRSFALELGAGIPATDHRLSSLEDVGTCRINVASDFVAQYTTRQEYRYAEALPDHGQEWLGFMRLDHRRPSLVAASADESADAATALAYIEHRTLSRKPARWSDARDILRRAAALLCRSDKDECAIAHYLVSIPFAMFTKESIKLGVSLWLGVMNENPRTEPRLLAEIAQQWEISIHKRLGLFSRAITHPDPFLLKQEFAPSDRAALARHRQLVHDLLAPHTRILQFFNSHYSATRMGNSDTQQIFLRLLDATLDGVRNATTTHPMAREIRFQVVLFGLRVLKTSTTIGTVSQWRLKDRVLSAALGWFKSAPRWSFGSNILQLKTELRLMSDVVAALRATSSVGSQAAGALKSLLPKEQLLLLLIESEQARLTVWVYPVGEPPKSQAVASYPNKTVEPTLVPLIRTAWAESPTLTIELTKRFPYPRVHREVRWLLLNFPERAVSEPEAIPVLLGGALPADVSFQLKYLLYWVPVNPITAVTFFLPAYQNHPFLIQYAMRALESHSVDVTFFYVPQIVQTLRYDALGYVERYIMETAQFSQLFAHQIIWNMKANSYKDDDAQVPDAIKPTLDHVMGRMVQSFSEADRQFYEREFTFFDEVTGISGKLKPLIKKSKPEKKQKIEEELRNVQVDVGVYLPSNPDGVVIGIDRKSGKPLQSHAKAPFMATFRIRKSRGGAGDGDEMLAASGGGAGEEGALQENGCNGSSDNNNHAEEGDGNTVEVWQSAIFKVGDDCRQDVLALQMIAAFRGIFHDVGLDVFVFPYRVTATGPGCGVIDVLPNSISRDMLGREAVNGLLEYFVSKYGNQDSRPYQQARSNFVKSMAAYSVISFLLQFKDRHNGNIMIDDAGHVLHIDFGFCFDIAPGGIKFERAPFKLTAEMLAVMGGGTNHQSFRFFEELCVKAFLAVRQHAEKLSQIVLLMMDSGLPCFRPESVKYFKERFVLDKTDREAADFMKELIRKSYASYSTGLYDQFQLLTNGIPY